jgi:MoaA/NifB/PqqE/SkfB family radical SAM enzyme
VDTLDAEKFHRITRWGKLQTVLEGIYAAEDAGLVPLKINTVVVRGYNDDDVADLAALTFEHPWQVRYIEMMPLDTHVAGSIHSHPNGILQPSPTDIHFFPRTGRYHIIIGYPYQANNWCCYSADGKPLDLEVIE